MITRIEAYRYRCFEKLDVPLGPYQVLVGKNGAGKSTLMDIPVLLGEMLYQRDIHGPLFKPGGRRPARATTPRDVLFNRAGDWCWFAIEARLPDAVADQIERTTFEHLGKKEQQARLKTPGLKLVNIRYELALRLVGEAFEISQESVFLFPQDRSLADVPAGLWLDRVDDNDPIVRCVLRRGSGGLTRIQPEGTPPNGGETRQPEPFPLLANTPRHTPALGGLQVDTSRFAASHWLRDFLADGILPISLDFAAMRPAQPPPGLAYRVAASGTTLPWSILDLSQRPRAYAEWLDHIRFSIPHLRTVRARQREDDHHAYLEVEYETGVTVRSVGLSDGTWAVLALSILPFLDNVPPFVAVEEPETGIHPKAIETVLESLSKMPNSQVWISTHSPVAVAVTQPEHLLCMRQNKAGAVEVTRGPDHPRLVDWQGTPSLATLFSAGVL
jgi:hypothetical protein